MIKEIINYIIGLLGVAVGLVGIFLTYRANQKDKKLKTIAWGDLHNALKHIWNKLKKINFSPDIIIAPDPKSGICAYILASFLETRIQIFIGYARLIIEQRNNIMKREDFFAVATNKWEVLLDKNIETAPDKENIKILIVDDFILSGDFNLTLKSQLCSLGYRQENIIDCCIVVTRSAIESNKAPNHHWMVVNDSDFYFPWGKAE